MEGFLNVLKPTGLTSHDVVLRVRQILGEEKIGHLGTLDPMARGVLPLALGSYTRLSEYFLDKDKDYLAEFIFGVSTETGDLDGRVVRERDCSDLDPSRISHLLLNLTGRIEQTPPKYSAVKIKGKKMYELARRGICVEPRPRKVMVYEFKMLSWKQDNHPKGVFFLRVGRGTYVRSLAESLGKMLGCGAAVSFLLRTRVGNFLLSNAHTLSFLEKAVEENRIHSAFENPLELLPNYRSFQVKTEGLNKIRNGGPLELNDFENPREVAQWFEHLTQRPNLQPTLFFATIPSSAGGQKTIVCVLKVSAQNSASHKIYKISYEKVLI